MAATSDLLPALQGLLAVVDKMDVHPSRGGGVLPMVKAAATYNARAAIAKAIGDSGGQAQRLSTFHHPV